jgi:UPF0271 protein
VHIDLNADVGEGCGEDAAMVAIATSANVATGAHAGGGEALAATVRQAARAGCAIGAHPSYRDRDNFGRVSHAARVPHEELAADIAEQIALVAQQCDLNGVMLNHVKAHGALYNDAAADAVVAAAVVEGVRQAAARLSVPSLAVFGLSSSMLERAVREGGGVFVREGFADRRYSSATTLQSRSVPGSVITDIDEACLQAVRLARRSEVVLTDGAVATSHVETICVHGDSPEAVSMAQAVRARLEAFGVMVVPMGRPQ